MKGTAKQQLAMVKHLHQLKDEIGPHTVVYHSNGIITIDIDGKLYKVYIKDSPLFDSSIREMTPSEFEKYQSEYENLGIPFHGKNLKTPIIQREGYPLLVRETEHFYIFEAAKGEPLTLDQLPKYLPQVKELIRGLDEPGFLIGVNTECFRVDDGKLICNSPCIHMHYPVPHHVLYSKHQNKKYLVSIDIAYGLDQANNDSYVFMSGSKGNKGDFVVMSEEEYMQQFGNSQ